ncbi:GIY-YIG nuclease family protein [Patescibacteria group bacterium]|nr:GIY-YIG nuclease family protein [Patescibacteria group bacterium]
MIYFIYIIKSKSLNNFYTGITNNINRRLEEHNQHRVSTPTTKKLTDYELVFCTTTESRMIARKTEIYLKSGIGREFRDNLLE